MLILTYWIKLFAQNLVQRRKTTTRRIRRCPRDQKCNRKSHDVITSTRATPAMAFSLHVVESVSDDYNL